MPNNVQKPDIDSVKLYEPGSSESNPFGYSGQFAVRELLLMTDSMQKLLRKPAHDITTTSIEEVATKDGMLTIMQDGVLRVLSGETSLKEVMRVLA
jgi:type IV pilus assembly protein PilB